MKDILYAIVYFVLSIAFIISFAKDFKKIKTDWVQVAIDGVLGICFVLLSVITITT